MPANMEVPGDETLLRKAAAGDTAAFEQLVERYYSMVHTVAYGRTRQWETAEDLAQEVFLRTYLSLEHITLPSQFPGWLVRVTHNLATDWNRRGLRNSRLVHMVPIEELHLEIADDSRKDARTMIPMRENERALEDAIFKLPETQRDIVLLHYTEGLSQKEVADRLDMHPSKVSRQLKRAIAAMRGSVETMLHESGPALRPPQSATVRAMALIGAVSALGTGARAALAHEAGGATSLTVMGAAPWVGKTTLQTSSLFPILSAGWRFMQTGKGMATLAAVSGIIGTTVLLNNHNGQAASSVGKPAKVVVTSPVAATPAHSLNRVSAAQATPAPQVSSRELSFPADRSLGRIMIQDESLVHAEDEFYYWTSKADNEWEFLAEARGAVSIPRGKRAWLLVGVDGVRDLSPLRNLPANSIHQLSFSYQPLAGMDTRTIATDEAVRHVASLSGLRDLNLKNGNVSAQGLAHIRGLRSLERLTMPHTVNRVGLVVVSGMPWLKFLYIDSRNNFSDQDLELLIGLPALEELSLNCGETFTAKGLAALRHLTNLRYLLLSGKLKKQAGGLAYVAQLPSLRTVNLGNSEITDADLADLSHSRSIQNLAVYHVAGITDAGIAHLRNMITLKKLSLSHTRIGDAGCARLSEMKQLQFLEMGGLNLSDRGLVYLAQMTELRALNISSPHYVAPGPGDIMYTPEGVKALTALTKLEELSIGANLIDDTAMDSVALMTGLKKLGLFGCPITNAGLAKLATLKNLEYLDIYNPEKDSVGKFTIGGLAVLNNMPHLEHVSISSVSNDGAVLNLAGLKQLEWLSLSLKKGDSFRDYDLACLSGLTKLKYLQLTRRGLTDAGMQHLAGLVNLERLFTGSPAVTDVGLKSLAPMHELEQLSLTGKFTDAGLSNFYGMKNLRNLDLDAGGGLSESGVQALRTRLPMIENLEAGFSKRPALVGMTEAQRKK